MRGPTNDRGVWVAVLVAIALLLVFGGGYRLVAEQLARPGNSAPLPAGSLGKLPLRMDDWAGRDMPLEPALVAATASDDHLYRAYQRHGGTETIGLYIAYGIKGRDLMPHRPEVCYPDAGWTRRSRDTARLALPDGTGLDCTLYEFSQSGLSARSMHVLNYFIVDGEYAPDVSLLRSKAWRGAGGIRYMAQVQVTISGGLLLGREAAVQSIEQFAVESARPIRALLPDAQGGPVPDASARGTGGDR